MYERSNDPRAPQYFFILLVGMHSLVHVIVKYLKISRNKCNNNEK